MLAKDSYCKTFDIEADGYARGKGLGVIVLKRLSEAIQRSRPNFRDNSDRQAV